MKKRIIFVSALSICVIALLTCAFLPASANDEKTGPVADNTATEARFLNMLNRNFCYDNDFESADTVMQNSLIAILDRRINSDSPYIPEDAAKGFVKDMYGIEIADIFEDEAVHKDGYVYIDPRGYTTYKHEIKSIIENEDGSFTVISDVTVNPHDDDEFVTAAQTLFVKNKDSAFGYNIICSNLIGLANGI